MNEPSETPRLTDRSPFVRMMRWLFTWRTLRRLLIGVACIATVLALLHAEETWRGKHAWTKFRQEWEAKGERFDLASFVPKPVPPEQNFCMTPCLAPLLDYEFKGHPREAVWKDTNAVERIKQIDIYGPNRAKAPSFGNMEKAELTDLREWQQFYRANTNFPSTPQPQDPARDVLFALSRFDAVMNELHEANRRPYAIFPVHYAEGMDVLLPNLAALKTLTTVLRLRATAYLEAGQTAEALRDIKLSFRLAETLKSEPLLISHLVEIAILQITLNSIWEGLANHRWNEPQLAELQKALASIDVLADYAHAMRGERAFSNDFMDKMRTGRVPPLGDISGESPMGAFQQMPGWAVGWFIYHNQLRINRLHQEHTLQVIDPAKHRIYPERGREMEDIPELRTTTPYNVFARMLFPAFAKSSMKSARAQTMLDLASVACALERFRIAHGQHPETLAALTPRFLERIPNDVINGESLKYRRAAEGHFVLYSVGWNEKDDGGVVAMSKGKTPGPVIESGDWIWRYPTP